MPTGPFIICHSWEHFDSFFLKKLNVELPHDTGIKLLGIFLKKKKKKKGKIGSTKETSYKCSEQLYAQ